MTIVHGPADLRDQLWLDQQIAAIDDGVEAVLDIARNWTDGRNVARLHPGVSAADYVKAHVTHALGKGIVVPLLEASDWSNRQIAEVAGVSEPTVRRTASDDAVDRPDRTLGADGKYRPARVVREVVAEVIEEDEEVNLETPDEASKSASYVHALRDYIAAIVRVQPPTLGDPPAEFRRRHELERRLQTVLTEVMSRRPAIEGATKENSRDDV